MLTAKKLKKLFKDMDIDLANSEIFLFCSPFLAAIESATAIIKGLEEANIDKINV
jgi:hypothetical protein